MTPTRSRPLLLVSLAIAVLSGLALRAWSAAGNELPALPWSAPGVMVLMAVAVLVVGLPVRQWTRGERTTPLDPLRAARTVVLAKAAQYAGALLSGWYAGQALALVATIDVGPRRAMLLRAVVALVTAVAVWVTGWLVEQFCRVDRSSDDDPPPPAPTH